MFRKNTPVIVNGMQGIVLWTSAQGVYVSVNGTSKYYKESDLMLLC